MEEARRKLRICLIFVVALAVLVGCIYYLRYKKGESISEGTLVMADDLERGGVYGVEQ